MTAHTFDESIFSDLYKDVYGTRPRTHEFYKASDARKQEIWEDLCISLEDSLAEIKRVEAESLVEFTARIEQLMTLGATSKAQAIKWLLEADNFSEHDLAYGPDYVCFHFNLSYAAKDKFPFADAISMLQEQLCG